jgi:hypothetical protein
MTTASPITIDLPHWITLDWTKVHGYIWHQRICLLAGLPAPSTPYHGATDGEAAIDASIALVIAALNAAGHTTLFSCSGLPEDHRDNPEHHPAWPYLLFAADCAPAADWRPAGVEVSWGADHWTFSRNPDVARQQWTELAERLSVPLWVSISVSLGCP